MTYSIHSRKSRHVTIIREVELKKKSLFNTVFVESKTMRKWWSVITQIANISGFITNAWESRIQMIFLLSGIVPSVRS